MSEYEAFICSSAVNLKVYYSNQTLSEVKEHFGHMICETDIMISNEQSSICVCGIKFKILHTPGHSTAHICIITPDDAAYLGDALISYEVMNGAKMPYALMLKEDLESKNKLYNLKCSKYIVAHKGIYDDIKELITDNISFYKHRSEKVYEVIKGTMRIEDIFKTVVENFNIHINSIYKYNVIDRSLKSYIEYLNEEGKIEAGIYDGFLKYSRVNNLK
jgi:glyoxylase-like metal-dependent hydrolase (beta-lactamase superfamily II)